MMTGTGTNPGWAAALLILLATTPAAAVTIFENGAVNDFSGSDPTGAIVRDSVGSLPTTLNLLPGASLGPTSIEDSSVLNMGPSASVTQIDALGSARVDLSGGTLQALDYQGGSGGSIAGGAFSGCSGRCLGLFGTAEVDVSGGSLSNGLQTVVSVNDDAALSITGGAFEGIVRAEDDALIEIFGGSIERIVATEQSTIVLYGDDFVASEGGSPVLVGFGDIDEGFNGTITGSLADASNLDITALNGVVGSRILLRQAPLAVPVLSGLSLGLLAGLLGAVADGGLRRQRRARVAGTRVSAR